MSGFVYCEVFANGLCVVCGNPGPDRFIREMVCTTGTDLAAAKRDPLPSKADHPFALRDVQLQDEAHDQSERQAFYRWKQQE